MNELHPTQNQILYKLKFSKGLHYSEMKPDKEMENNQFQFHLDQLLKKGYVTKSGDIYELAGTGKQYVKKLDSETGKVVKQPHVSVRVACIKNTGPENEYLFYTRLMHPYYGCQGFPAGKLEHGETLMEAAKREIQEETGLTGEPKMVAVTHYIDIDGSGECLTDKLMFLFTIMNPSGDLVGSKEGKYEWIKRSEVESKILKPFENIEGVLKELDILDKYDHHISFIEKVNNVEGKF